MTLQNVLTASLRSGTAGYRELLLPCVFPLLFEDLLEFRSARRAKIWPVPEHKNTNLVCQHRTRRRIAARRPCEYSLVPLARTGPRVRRACALMVSACLGHTQAGSNSAVHGGRAYDRTAEFPACLCKGQREEQRILRKLLL